MNVWAMPQRKSQFDCLWPRHAPTLSTAERGELTRWSRFKDIIQLVKDTSAATRETLQTLCKM